MWANQVFVILPRIEVANGMVGGEGAGGGEEAGSDRPTLLILRAADVARRCDWVSALATLELARSAAEASAKRHQPIAATEEQILSESGADGEPSGPLSSLTSIPAVLPTAVPPVLAPSDFLALWPLLAPLKQGFVEKLASGDRTGHSAMGSLLAAAPPRWFVQDNKCHAFFLSSMFLFLSNEELY